MTNKGGLTETNSTVSDCIVQYEFLKSALTVNPCMVSFENVEFCFYDCVCFLNSRHIFKFYGCDNYFFIFVQSHQTHLFLQGADKLYVNLGSGGLTKVYQMQKPSDSSKDCVTVISTLVESKQWVIVPLPATYLSTNWPIRVRIYFNTY